MGLEKLKVWNIFLWERRLHLLKRRKALVDHVDVLGAKYGNMMLLLKHLDLLVPKENIAIIPITWTVVPTKFSYKTCSKQYTGSTESFRSRFNNCKSAQMNFIKRNNVKKASFPVYVEDDKHHGMSHWKITFIYMQRV